MKTYQFEGVVVAVYLDNYEWVSEIQVDTHRLSLISNERPFWDPGDEVEFEVCLKSESLL